MTGRGRLVPHDTAAKVLSEFPDGVALPAALRKLCEHLDEHGYPLSGCFELRVPPGEAEAWFPGDAAMQRQVAIFGRGATGSSFALWLARSTDPELAPVVVLGDEGDCRVLAESSAEFCRLLACGYDEVEHEDLSAEPAPGAEIDALRSWLRRALGLSAPTTGQELVRRAESKFPGFSEWVTSWQDAHLGQGG